MTTTSRSRSEAFTVLRSIANAAARLRDEVENQRFRRGRRVELLDAHAALGRLLDTPLPEGTPDKFDGWCKGLRDWRANHTPLPERFDDHEKPPVLSNLARWFGDAVDDMERGLSDEELANSVASGEARTGLSFPAKWYNTATDSALYPELLGRAWRDGRIRGAKVGKRNHYELGSVCAAYPDYRARLEDAAGAEHNANQREPTRTSR